MATIAIIVLVVIDVALVAWALSPRDPGEAGDARVAVEQPPTPSPDPAEPAPSEEPAPVPEQAEPQPGVPLQRIIDASSSDDAWRVETGSCPDGGGSVERTTDGGESWEAAEIDQDAFVRLKDSGGATAWVVAVEGEDCEPVFVGTTTGGQEWGVLPGSLAAAWYVEPGDGAAVHSPEGVQAGPCDADVVDLAPVTSEDAGLLCPDGRVFTTDDGAVSWGERVVVPGAVALTDADGGYLAAALGAEGCDGVQVVTAGEGSAEALGCAAGPGEAGQVALSAFGETVWLWAGADVRVSGDGGRTWG